MREAEIADLVARKAVRLEALERDGSVLFPGARDAIARMAAARPMAIASGALKAEILRVLDHEALRVHFPGRRVRRRHAGQQARPGAVSARRRTAGATVPGLQPSECVAIEDSKWGLVSARAAGLRTVGITHTYAAAELAERLTRSSITSIDSRPPARRSRPLIPFVIEYPRLVTVRLFGCGTNSRDEHSSQ